MGSKKELFLPEYDDDLSREIAERCYIPEELTDSRRPLAALAQGLAYWISIEEIAQMTAEEASRMNALIGEEPLRTDPPAEILYYVLQATRVGLPDFLPVHDVCLLAANLLAGALCEQGHLVLLDWEMLPAAVLVTGAAESGIRITLPPCSDVSGEEAAAAKIMSVLQKTLPHVTWEQGKKEIDLPKDSLILGLNPLRHTERDSHFLEKLEKIRGGILYSTWDFLGVKIHAHTRSFWLKSGLIRGILQLPRPRRQGTVTYPALIELGMPEKEQKTIRMAHIPSCRSGAGALDITHALSLLHGSISVGEKQAIDVSVERIASDGLFDLSPAYYLAQGSLPIKGNGTLRQYAQVLRCQLPRERIADSEIDGWMEDYSDGSFIVREVSLGELDPLSGFLNEYGGNIVKVKLTRFGKKGKYLLQPNDIIFAFRGTHSSIGQVGLVEEEGSPCITGQSLCIIRPLPGIDAVWLYYYLQRSTIREWIQGRASGSTLLTVNLESIRDIPIEDISTTEVKEINKEHLTVIEAMAVIAQQRRIVRASLRHIWDIGHTSEHIARMNFQKTIIPTHGDSKKEVE